MLMNAVWFVVAGMAIVFATLGLLWGSMAGLNRLLKPGKPPK